MPTDLHDLLERLGGAAAGEADGVGRFFLVIPVRGDAGSVGGAGAGAGRAEGDTGSSTTDGHDHDVHCKPRVQSSR
jgi:hypothetical protein